MAWSLDGITIHVDDEGDEGSIATLWAIQQVLDATEENISYYGAQSPRRNLAFILDENVNSNTGLDTLKATTSAGDDAALVTDHGADGTYKIMDFTWVRRQALNKTNPVYFCRATLIEV